MLKPIISADSHVSEPPNCYLDHIDPAFRELAPRIVHDEKRGDMFHIEGSKTPIPMSLVSAAGKDARELSAEGAVFEKLHCDGWEPHARIGDQNEGWNRC